MTRRFRGNPSVHIRGFEKEMSLFLDSANLCLTKPGGVCITEAATKGVPMMFVFTVAGCEDHNRRFFLQNGLAEACADPAQIARFLREPADHTLAQNVFAGRDGAEIVYQTMTRKGETP